MITLTLNDSQHHLVISLLQGEIPQLVQQIADYNGSLSNFVTKEELQEYLAELEQLLKLTEV